MLRALRMVPFVGAMLIVLAMVAGADPANYQRSIANVLIHEGSTYENHPSDPGGPTKFGITIYDVRKYVKKDATANDVRRLTKETALWIYKTKYWDAIRGDELPKGLDYTVFDYGVNSGNGRSGKVLRRVLGLDDDSWRVTDEVLVAIKAANTATLIRKINDERIRFLHHLRTWSVFGRGWGRRVASVRSISLEMAGVTQAGVGDGAPRLPAFGPHRAFEFGIPDEED
jgi:lysozyme family protein